MSTAYVMVFLGGGVGSILRLSISLFVGKQTGGDFPWGTLAVNLIGAFIIGLIVEMFALKVSPSENIRYLLVTGFLGGFTTFSAFSLESTLLLTKGDYISLVGYVSASVIGTILLVLAAMHLARGVL
jgi:CrcB protein